jgi:Fur family transcriptional regulator, ferric uptake regulator
MIQRDTRQKNAIRKALFDAGRPLSVREILETAQNEVSGLGVATVYRNLKALQAERTIVHVDLPGQPARWELPEGHHHHFLCRVCDKVFEISDCPEDLVRLLPQGYTLEEHDILLRGQCDACSKKNTSRIIRSHLGEHKKFFRE